MYQEIEKIAQERFASESERQAFIEGFEKVAFVNWGRLAPRINATLTGRTGAEAITRALSTGAVGLGVGLAGMAAAKGIMSGSSAISGAMNRSKFEKALAEVLATNRIVKTQPERAKKYAETIFKFGPNVAGDPHLLASLLSNFIQGESIDPISIKTIVDLEGRYKDNNSVYLPKF